MANDEGNVKGTDAAFEEYDKELDELFKKHDALMADMKLLRGNLFSYKTRLILKKI
jgi:hypothetical protein